MWYTNSNAQEVNNKEEIKIASILDESDPMLDNNDIIRTEDGRIVHFKSISLDISAGI